MPKKGPLLYWILFLLLLINGACKKFFKEGQLDEAGIVLTFDDNRVNNWIKFLPALDSSGVRATFYISNYNRFTREEKEKLRTIRDHGHEIAFHGTNHLNMVEYVNKQKHVMNELIENEIELGMNMMKKDGFDPVTFAYPYGSHNAALDKELVKHFKSVRALNGTMDFSKSLVSGHQNTVLYGLGIDKSSKRSDADVINLLQSAKNNNDCAIMVAHDIDGPNKFSVTRERLMQIFSFVKNNNMRYFTVKEVSVH